LLLNSEFVIVSCFVQKRLPGVIDDMLLFSLAVQFEHTNWSKDEQNCSSLVLTSVFASVGTCVYLQYKLGTCTCTCTWGSVNLIHHCQIDNTIIEAQRNIDSCHFKCATSNLTLMNYDTSLVDEINTCINIIYFGL